MKLPPKVVAKRPDLSTSNEVVQIYVFGEIKTPTKPATIVSNNKKLNKCT